MRNVPQFLSRLALAGLLLFTAPSTLRGDDSSTWSPRRVWLTLANGRADFEVSDLASVPSKLLLAAEQSGCRYKEGIEQAPMRFVSFETFRFAIQLCPFGITTAHQIFDLSSGSSSQTPKPIEVPVLAMPNGFATTARPGWITWERNAGSFSAETQSDLMPSPRIRQTYRFGSRGFAIVRVEAQPDGPGEWTTIWDAPPWSFPVKPK